MINAGVLGVCTTHFIALNKDPVVVLDTLTTLTQLIRFVPCFVDMIVETEELSKLVESIPLILFDETKWKVLLDFFMVLCDTSAGVDWIRKNRILDTLQSFQTYKERDTELTLLIQNLKEAMHSSPMPELSVSHSQSLQNSQNSQSVQNSQNSQSSQNLQTLHSLQSSQNSQSSQHSQNLQSLQNSQNLQSLQNSQNSQTLKNLRGSEGSQSLMNSRSSEGSQGSENAEKRSESEKQRADVPLSWSEGSELVLDATKVNWSTQKSFLSFCLHCLLDDSMSHYIPAIFSVLEAILNHESRFSGDRSRAEWFEYVNERFDLSLLIPCMSYACYHHKQNEDTMTKFGVIASLMIHRFPPTAHSRLAFESSFHSMETLFLIVDLVSSYVTSLNLVNDFFSVLVVLSSSSSPEARLGDVEDLRGKLKSVGIVKMMDQVESNLSLHNPQSLQELPQVDRAGGVNHPLPLSQVVQKKFLLVGQNLGLSSRRGGRGGA